MYPKSVTQEIVKAWAKGATAEETVQYLQDELKIHVCLNTIYKKRHSLEAQEMIDELLRQQLREIVSAEDKELKLKYRNELLKILIPFRVESKHTEELIATKQVIFQYLGWKSPDANNSNVKVQPV